MSDRKTERLINLTLALLATKRYLKKSEILANVAGYEGSPESQDRMFERDKDDLRSLGIDIEVGDLDIFFEDEPGYRIAQNSYELNITELTPRDLALLSVAANYWNGSILAADAQSGIRKLNSLGIPTAFDFDLRIKYKFENPAQHLDILSEAITTRRSVTFSYDSYSLKFRQIDPYRILIWNGYWYLIGFDHDRKDIRIFKLSRMVSDIKLSKKKSVFEIPEEFDAEKYLPTIDLQIQHLAKIRVKKGVGLILRERGKVLQEAEDSDLVEIGYENEATFLREILWNGTNVEIIEPINLRELLVSTLNEFVL